MIRLDSDNKRRQRRSAWLLAGLIMGVVIGTFVFFVARPPQQSPGSDIAQTATDAVSISTSSLSTPLPVASTVTIIEPPAADVEFGVKVGRPAPDFTLPTLEGDYLSLADYRGQPVLINFWASWCPPCRLEMPDLVQAYEDHRDEGFVVLAVDLTFQDSLPDVEAFVEEFDMTFPVLLDRDGTVTNGLYRLLGLPMSVFVDRDGVITRVHIGAMSGEQVDEFVAEILN